MPKITHPAWPHVTRDVHPDRVDAWRSAGWLAPAEPDPDPAQPTPDPETVDDDADDLDSGED